MAARDAIGSRTSLEVSRGITRCVGSFYYAENKLQILVLFTSLDLAAVYVLASPGVQLVLTYSWTRPAVLVAGKGSGWGCFCFFCVFFFFFFFCCCCFFVFLFFVVFFVVVVFSLLSPLSLFFITSTISSISLLPFSGRRHKMTHNEMNHNARKRTCGYVHPEKIQISLRIHAV